ncbi:MAG: hypothetical protein AAFY77_06505 [Pseudomonadota bacterium]
MKKITLALSLALVTAATAAPARISEVHCDDRDGLRDRLQANHGAQLVGHGLRDPDTVIEIWSTPSTGDWTLVQTYTSGRACILAMGVHWEPVRGPDAPS